MLMDLQSAIIKVKEDYQNPERKNEEIEVIARYGNIFYPPNLDNLTRDDFKSFLLIRNNKHWDGIHRQGNMITEDMERLRNGLKILLDESKTLKHRLNTLFPKNRPNYIKGLGRAIVTPLLLVVYPDKYGVYNTRSSDGLEKVGLKPTFKRGASFADKYIKVNAVLNSLARENEMSLFQLDNVWWEVTGGRKQSPEEEEKEAEELITGFGLEPHLRRFLVDNWENTPLGSEYEILTEDGDITGEEYRTSDAGIIDILAKEKNTGKWVVIELKKGKTSDAVVGQILRYIGWVDKNLVEADEGVKGIIIVKEIDRKMKYALSPLVDNLDISCYEYRVQFSLNEVTI